MRLFDEAWMMLDPNLSVMTDELQPTDCEYVSNSSVMTDELAISPSITTDVLNNFQIDIYQSIQIPEIKDFLPIEDSFKVPFIHHKIIRSIVKETEARYYYTHRTVEEHLQTRTLEKLIMEDAYGNIASMPCNFTNTLPNTTIARKAVMMFKDSYLLDFINVEQMGERDAMDIDECEVENKLCKTSSAIQ